MTTTMPATNFAVLIDACRTLAENGRITIVPQSIDDLSRHLPTLVNATRDRRDSAESRITAAQARVADLKAAIEHRRSLERRASAGGPVADYTAISAARTELEMTPEPEPGAITEAEARLAVAIVDRDAAQQEVTELWGLVQQARELWEAGRSSPDAGSGDRYWRARDARVWLQKAIGFEPE